MKYYKEWKLKKTKWIIYIVFNLSFKLPILDSSFNMVSTSWFSLIGSLI